MKTISRLGVLFLCFAASFSLIPKNAVAQTVSFDFEDQTPTPGRVEEGRISALTMAKDGFGMRITRPGSLFDLVDNSAAGVDWQKPDSFGNVTLSTFFDSHSTTPIIIDFSGPISSFALDIGDFSQDNDILEIEAFAGPGGTGKSVDRKRTGLDNNNDSYDKFSFQRLEVQGEAIRSVRILSGSSAGPHSMYYDNLTIEKYTPQSG